jgi:DeoR family transcriptional regulator, aga operon transcriptional repressor
MTATNDVLPAQLRRERILAVVAEHEFVRVTDLADVFGVSSVTIRSDLDALVDQGAVRRVRGGVIRGKTESAIGGPADPPRADEERERAAIARTAAQLVASGESIVIDAGATADLLARELVGRTELHDVVAVTTGLRTALELEAAIPRISVLVSGGTLQRSGHSMVDPLGTLVLNEIHTSIAFIGCHGVHPERGVTNVSLQDAQIQRRLLGTAERKILVAESSKIGRVGFAPICPIEEIDILITGSAAHHDTVFVLRERGLEVLLVD